MTYIVQVQVDPGGAWTEHSRWGLAGDATDQADMVHGRVVLEGAEPDTDDTVACTGCGVALSRDDAKYADHADTYSGTTWHCPACWAACEAEGAR